MIKIEGLSLYLLGGGRPGAAGHTAHHRERTDACALSRVSLSGSERGGERLTKFRGSESNCGELRSFSFVSC